ncbi:hypothetical protein BC835DRAFT_1313233 [Cytidiella melzeri]|nr:hypothetical protein BC835DRAFT_1313233 [Cytidiella melzeri]
MMDRNLSSASSLQVQHSSPLESLVRRASSRRAKVAKLADALSVQYTPPRQAHTASQDEATNSPHSPLLHTQFRGSVSTYDGSIAGDTSGTWESPRRAPQTALTSRSYQPSEARAVSMASQYSIDSHSSMRGGAMLSMQPGNNPPAVPTVVSSSEAKANTPSLPSSTRMRQTSGASSSRPSPPPIGPDEQKRQVLLRNSHSHSGTSIRSRRPSTASSQPRPTFQQTSSIPLPRSNSQLSVYTSYSYYPYDSQAPSPSASSTHIPPTSVQPSPTIAIHPPSPSQDPPRSPTATNDKPESAQEFLQLGIQHHLANQLSESASCFEKSATIDGGCGMGMLMWGLAQRHGWGCAQSEAKGFKWLKRAAELAVDDLETKRAGMDSGVVKSELVLAIYEVGQSFFRGWGVEKDKKMAVKYFRLASDLGDPDAQQELAFCLANGKGCKKDRKEAAKWYREAVSQGVSDVGLAWIYKEKFQ